MPQFRKGQSGNPTGRPKVPAEIQTAARAHSLTAIQTLANICTSGTDENARIKAAEALLNRAWGKPVESHEVTGANGGPLTSQSVPVGMAALRAALQAHDEGGPDASLTLGELAATRNRVLEEY